MPGAEAIALEEERGEKLAKLKTPIQEEADLRKAFIDAANDDDNEDNDLFIKKKKSLECWLIS